MVARTSTAALAAPPAFLGKAQRSPYLHGNDNGRVVLTAQDLSAKDAQANLVPTKDPADRAHTTRDQFGLLIPAAIIDDDGHARPNPEVRHARPRRYPASSIAGNGIAYDSAFDEWYEAKRRLAAEGIQLGGHGLALAAALGLVESRCKETIRLRDVIEQKTRVRATRSEIELDRAASRLLQKARDQGIKASRDQGEGTRDQAAGISRDRNSRLRNCGTSSLRNSSSRRPRA